MTITTIEHFTEPLSPGMCKVIPVTERYVLSESAEKKIRDVGYKFGFGAFSETVYRRTYSRIMPNGKKEHFPDTVIRTVNGIFTLLVDWNLKRGLYWSDEELEDNAVRMGICMMKMKFLPPGRGLFINNTSHVFERGSFALNNCGFISQREGLVNSCTWTVNALMEGTGVGFDTRVTDEFKNIREPGCSECNFLHKLKYEDDKINDSCSCNKVCYKIHDSREGWVFSVNMIIDSYFTGKLVLFDYSHIRPPGAEIKGFGGESSGFFDLHVLHERIRAFMTCFIEVRDNLKTVNEATIDMVRKLINLYPESNTWDRDSLNESIEKIKTIEGKTYGTTRLVCDIFNAIGICIVSGNIRRSSEIAMGRPDDREFLDLKNLKVNPERYCLSWMSNNTVYLEKTSDFEYIDEIAERIRDNGEPGIFNTINSKYYGRIGRREPIGREAEEDPGIGLNPCVSGDTLIKTSSGYIRADELVGKQFTAVVDGENYLSTNDGFWSNGIKDVFKITLKNGSSIKTTDNHRLLAYYFDEDLYEKKNMWKRVDELNLHDELVLDCDKIGGINEKSEIVSIVPCGREDVFDCTIPGPNCYTTNFFIKNHNCGESVMCSYELCNLSEILPTRCNVIDSNGKIDMTDLNEAVYIATLYSSIVSLLPTQWASTNAVISKNRRIGVSMSGIADFMHKVGTSTSIKIFNEMYAHVRKTNSDFALRAGIPAAIRCTVVKPSGSISLMPGVSPGMHQPTFRKYIRRVRLSNTSDLIPMLDVAGYKSEPDVMNRDTTIIYEFPIYHGETRTAENVSMWEQSMNQILLQSWWADNSVSCTIYFNPETEASDLKHLLALILPQVKSVSLLPHTPMGVYAQAPYEKISDEQYDEMIKGIKPLDWSIIDKDTNANKKVEDSEMSRGCDGDSCSLAAFKLMREDEERRKKEEELANEAKNK